MNPGQIIFDGSMLLAIGIAIAAGLVSFLLPCVLPLVPGYLGFLSGMAPAGQPAAVAPAPGGDGAGQPGSAAVGTRARVKPVRDPGRGRLLLGVTLFIAGFTVVFVTIFVLGGTVGMFFIAYSDIITRIMGVVVIGLGLVFLGAFGFAQRTLRPELRGNAGLIGAPLLGLAMGIGWAPCIGPTMGSILALSINTGDVGRAAVLGVAYSLGLGIPFILIAFGFGWAAKSLTFLRRHIRAINIIGGSLLVVLGVLMVTGVWNEIMSRLAAVVGSVELPL